MAGRKKSLHTTNFQDALARFKAAVESEQPELLQESLDLQEPQSLEEVEAQAAGLAIIESAGRPSAIIAKLGYNPQSHGGERTKAIVKRITRLPGVMERVRKHYGDLEAMREKVLARQVFTALYGRDDSATAAAALLAKIGGWIAPTRIDQNVTRKSWNIHSFLQEHEVQNALSKLKHEPGEASIVMTEARELAEESQEDSA